eukprot:m.58143 g.58143  ORF g.58143 m.58143 type:complete len:615 (+) comp22504_c0_seq1:188-2032(+)
MALAKQLSLESVIGFGGGVKNGLIVHVDREHLLYPLGCNVVVEKIAGKRTQSFLKGHDDFVSVVTVSKSGKYVASGQVNKKGGEAMIIVWDFQSRTELHRLKLHRQHIESLSISPNDLYLVSLGGPDDSTVALWDLVTGKALAGSPTGTGRSGMASCVLFSPHADNVFILGGLNMFRIWNFGKGNKLIPTDCRVRGLKRTVTCMGSHENSDAVYFGTTTGDIIEIGLDSRNLMSVGPTQLKFVQGVQSITVLSNGNLIVGAGDGTVALVNPKKWSVLKTKNVEGVVTSIAIRGDGHEFFVGTNTSNIYRFGYDDFTFSHRFTGHNTGVKDVCFPKDCAELFGTCAGNEIRIWHAPSSKVALRIKVDTHQVCNVMAINPMGHMILSGWDDGVVRAFLPESGRKLFEAPNSNSKGVTAISFFHQDASKFVTGSGDGQVRVWQIGSGAKATSLTATFKEHSAVVTSIHVAENDNECVTSSEDGTCIVWNLQTFTRTQIIFANTLFHQVRYTPDESQLLTVGTDRKVGWWEVYDGSLIRDQEVSRGAHLNALEISKDGFHFAVGGSDKLLQIFGYKNGNLVAVGTGHAASISKIKIDPSQSHVISVSDDGAICKWKYL